MTIYHEDLPRLTNKDKSTYQRKKKRKKVINLSDVNL